MEIDVFILLKTLFVGGALVGCGFILGRDKGIKTGADKAIDTLCDCLLYTSPSPRDLSTSRMPSSA